MRPNKSEKSCCLDADGRKFQFNLCCRGCREVMAADLRRQLIEGGFAPVECGPDVIRIAPARGRVETFQPNVLLPDGKGGMKHVAMGYRDRSAMRQRDVFDVMADQAQRAGGRAPFSPVEVGAGRDYRTLVERLSGAGYKGSAVFDDSRGGGGKVDVMDAHLQDVERLHRMQRAIGGGSALSVRRVRPSTRAGRIEVGTRVLCDMVCLADSPLSAILQAHGWQKSSKATATLRDALSAALTRLARG